MVYKDMKFDGRKPSSPCRQLISPTTRLVALTAAIRGVLAGDRYPHAPRLDPLRAALARLEAAGTSFLTENKSGAAPGASLAAKGDKRARR
jgi:hypothetical protein